MEEFLKKLAELPVGTKLEVSYVMRPEYGGETVKAILTKPTSGIYSISYSTGTFPAHQEGQSADQIGSRLTSLGVTDAALAAAIEAAQQPSPNP